MVAKEIFVLRALIIEKTKYPSSLVNLSQKWYIAALRVLGCSRIRVEVMVRVRSRVRVRIRSIIKKYGFH